MERGQERRKGREREGGEEGDAQEGVVHVRQGPDKGCHPSRVHFPPSAGGGTKVCVVHDRQSMDSSCRPS